MRVKVFFSKLLKKNPKTTFSNADKSFLSKLNHILGLKINNIEIYKEAFSVKSTQNYQNYERLEFLGDAILGSIISCYIYKNYPNENEGFLTQLKSKIVNRKNLNRIGDKLKLRKMILGEYQTLSEDISGNLLEALIGAIVLDHGYEKCKEIVMRQFLCERDIRTLENKVVSYKGLLLEWGQKKRIQIDYTTEEEFLVDRTLVFRSSIFVGGKYIISATESSKKKSEEKVAQRAFYALNKKENILENKKNIT